MIIRRVVLLAVLALAGCHSVRNYNQCPPGADCHNPFYEAKEWLLWQARR